jgi:hypothetical protein
VLPAMLGVLGMLRVQRMLLLLLVLLLVVRVVIGLERVEGVGRSLCRPRS